MIRTHQFAEEKTEGGELGEVYIICRQDMKADLLLTKSYTVIAH